MDRKKTSNHSLDVSSPPTGPLVRSRSLTGHRAGAGRVAACRGRVIVGDCPVGRLVGLLRRHTSLSVCLAEPDWDQVDEARASLDAAGLADRVSVHHASAFSFARSSIRAAS